VPVQVEFVVKCEMSALQRQLYRFMQKHNILVTDATDLSKAGGAAGGGAKSLQNTLMQLRKICNHPFIFESVERGVARHLGLAGPVVNTIDLMRGLLMNVGFH
jgi:SNF2 family DNA or RNA helicase